MIANAWRRRIRIATLVPLVGLLFWLTAVTASVIPGLLVLGVNVHSLSLPGYAGDPGVALAPLSTRIIGEAQNDASLAAASLPSPTPAHASSPYLSASGSARPGSSAPSASAAPSVVPSPVPGTTPSASPTILPLPTLSPTATAIPSILPTPTPIPSLTPAPTPTPSPTPTATPTPTPTPAPTIGKGTILAQVIDTVSHLPIVGATVTLSTSGTTVASAITDVNGNVSFSVDPASYTLTGSSAGYNSASQSVSVSGGGRVSVTLKLLSLAATGGIKGTVTNNAKQPVPIAGATLTLSTGLTTVTDVNGNYSLPVVPYGTYTLTASAAGYLSQSVSVTVLGGHTTPVNFALAP